MIAFGWTEEHLYEACRYVSGRLTREGGVPVALCYPEVKSYKCKRGNCTIQFTLKFAYSTARRKDGTYPAGSAYRTEWGNKILPIQPIPTPEVIQGRHGFCKGRDYEDVLLSRSTSSLCWHAFGHFMAKLFELNPAGKLRTSANIYDGVAGFRMAARYNKNQTRHECDCHDHDLIEFMQVQENDEC